MAGFGGSASLALLTGIFSGQNKAAEEKRTIARQNVLNQATQAQIDESKARIERQERDEQKQRAQERRLDLETRQEEEHNQRRLGTVAGLIQRNQPDLSDEEAFALAEVAPAATLNQMLKPAEVEELSALDRARLAEIEARTAEREAENSAEAQIRDLTNSPEGLRIRQALVDGDKAALEIAVAAARGSGVPGEPGFDETTILQYMDSVQPKDEEGNIRLTDSQKSAARVRGAGMAQRIVQQAGSIEAAIAGVTQQIMNGGADNEFDRAQQNETLKALERMKAQAEKDEGDEPDELARLVAERLARGGG